MMLPSRRAFLFIVSLITAVAGAAVVASAWTHGGEIPFNGGKSQINFNFLPLGGEYPFIDIVKAGDNWKYTSAPNKDTVIDPSNLDANGFPTSMQAGGYYSVTFIPTSDPTTGRPGNYVARWTSTGSASTVNTLGTIQSGSASTTGSTGRYVFTPTTTRLVIGAVSMTGGYVSSLSVMHVDDEAAWLRGEIFGTQFKATLQQANPGVVRFLNWQGNSGGGANISNVTTWATRKPIGHWSYNAPEYRSSLYLGATTNSGDSYSINAGISNPADKQTSHVKWNAAVSASVTAITFASNTIGQPITVNWTAHGFSAGTPLQFDSSGGALPTPLGLATNAFVSATNLLTNSFEVTMTSGGSTALITAAGTASTYSALKAPLLSLDNGSTFYQLRSPYGGILTAGFSPSTTGYSTIVFDSDINSFLHFSGVGINSGVPPELMLRLAREIGAHPWIVSPFLAVDPMTDWNSSLAAYAKVNSASWMIPRFEGVNENWNNAFYGTRYGWGKAFIHWGTNFDQNNWQGKTISTIGQAVNAAYGAIANDGTKYQIINGAQAASFTSTGSSNGNDTRMTSAAYVAQAAAPQSGYTRSAASGWASHMALAHYVYPDTWGTGTETTLAAAYAGGDQSALSTYIDVINSGTGAGSLSAFRTKFANAFTWSQKFTNSGGVKIGMCAYEGGAGYDLTGSPTTQVANLRVASSMITDWGKILTGGTLVSGAAINGLYNDFTAAGGLFPSLFQFGGGSGTGTNSGSPNNVAPNVWSALQPDIYAAQPPQWSAISAYNH